MSGCLFARNLSYDQIKPGIAVPGFTYAPCWSVDVRTLPRWPVCSHFKNFTVWAQTPLVRAVWRQVSGVSKSFFLSQSGSGESALRPPYQACSSAVISGVGLIGGN